MKKAFIIFSVLVLASCSPKGPEAIQKQIAGYKNQINKLNQKIAVLEETLLQDSLAGITDQKTIVETTEIQYREFSHYITVSGKVSPEQEAHISPELNGQVHKIHVKEGQRVRKGELLVSLRTDVTEASIREVETGLELASKLYEKQKELWEQRIGSEIQYLQARNNKESLEARLATLQEQLNMSSIVAPFDGLVDRIAIKEGEMASPGAQLLHLVNLRRLRITADISESYLRDIQKGEKVEVEFPSFPEMTKTLPVIRLGNVVDNKSRTFEVEVLYENFDEKIKPNQFVNIRINDFKAEEALVVPSIIIRQDIQGNFLFVAKGEKGNMIAEKVYVKPGKSYLEETMVEEGITPGQLVITKGYNLVKNGTEVTN
jgi:membrane fusion protein, multidrug efflux system